MKTIEEQVLDLLGGIEKAKKYIDDPVENDTQYNKLFDFFMNISEVDGGMPYGTMKARTGDPYDWIYNYVYKLVDDE